MRWMGLWVVIAASACMYKGDDDDDDDDDCGDSGRDCGGDGQSGLDPWGDGGAGSEGEGEGEVEVETADSCWFGASICIEANEGDNESWCGMEGGTYSADSCPSGAVVICDLPVGGAYAASAVVYYYDMDVGSAEAGCTGAGGTVR